MQFVDFTLISIVGWQITRAYDGCQGRCLAGTQCQPSKYCQCKLGFTNKQTLPNGTFACLQDIDECKINAFHCDENSVCENTYGAYTCTCNTGFHRNKYGNCEIDEASALNVVKKYWWVGLIVGVILLSMCAYCCNRRWSDSESLDDANSSSRVSNGVLSHKDSTAVVVGEEKTPTDDQTIPGSVENTPKTMSVDKAGYSEDRIINMETDQNNAKDKAKDGERPRTSNHISQHEGNDKRLNDEENDNPRELELRVPKDKPGCDLNVCKTLAVADGHRSGVQMRKGCTGVGNLKETYV